jgi:hypothetical protein
MKKNILEEIYRTQKLMGVQTRKPLVTEQLSVLIKAIQAGGKNMDDLIELVTKGVAKGEVIGSKEIDELVEQVKSTGKYTDDEIEIFRNFLKKPKVTAHIQSGEGLFTKIDNLTDDITEMEAELLSRLAKLSDNEIEKIISSLVMKSADNITNLPLYLKLETVFTNQLDDILNDSTKYINSIDDDIYKPIDDYLDNRFKISDDASDVAKETNKKWLNEFKSKVRENPKLTQKIKELQDAGKIGPRQTPSVVDDVEDVVDDVEDVIDDSPVEEWGSMTDNYGTILGPWAHRFFFRFCKFGFCEAIVDFARSLNLKTPQQFVNDTTYTLRQLDGLYEQFSRLNPEDANYKVLKPQIESYVSRLKSNMKLMSTKETGFASVWDATKASIRNTIDDSAVAERFIDYLENKAKTTGNETIGEFIEIMRQYTKPGWWSNLTSARFGDPQWWKELTPESVRNYADEVSAEFKKEPRFGGYAGKFTLVLSKLLIDFLFTLVGRFANYFTIGTFRYFGKMILRLRAGRFTGLEGLRRYILLYIELTFISNIVNPFIEYASDLIDVQKELWLIEGGEQKTDIISPEENLYNNLIQRIPLIGNDFEWNPFFNPIGGITDNNIGSALGFKPAPLPAAIFNMLNDGIKHINKLESSTTGENVTGKRQDNVMKEMDEILKNSVDEKEVQQMAYDNQFDAIKISIENNVSDKFTKDEVQFLISRMSFDVTIPADYSKILKNLNPEAYEKQFGNIDFKTINVKDLDPDKIPRNGEAVITDNYNNKYILVMYSEVGIKVPKDVNLNATAPNSKDFPEQNKSLYGRVVWVKPSLKDLKSTSTRTYHNLREFLNLNYKPKK